MAAKHEEKTDKTRSKHKLLEHEAFMLLAKYGIPFPPYGLARSPEEAGKIATEIGFPVVLKIVSPDISHKTDVGGVLLGLNTLEEVVAGYKSIINNVKTRAPTARLEGVLVQKMISGGAEIIIGGVRDPVFGVLLMFGLGGIFTEVLRDVSFRVWPMNREDALEMIHEIKGYKILEGYRGEPPVDVESIIDIIIKLGKLLEENPEIESADLNPVKAFPKGSLVVDARFILGRKTDNT